MTGKLIVGVFSGQATQFSYTNLSVLDRTHAQIKVLFYLLIDNGKLNFALQGFLFKFYLASASTRIPVWLFSPKLCNPSPVMWPWNGFFLKNFVTEGYYIALAKAWVYCTAARLLYSLDMGPF